MIINNQLPVENIRDFINLFRQDIKFKYVPFRLYYKYRALKYAKKKTPELNLVKYLIKKDQISLDVGANLGLFTFFLSRHSKKVFAFEPNPYPLRYLPDLIDSNVELMKIAISDSNQKMHLLIPKSAKGWSSNGATLKDIDVKNGIKIEVECRTIDSFDYSNVGLIKIDVEGAEKNVLVGAKKTIQRNKPNLMIENEIVHQNDTNEIFKIIQKMDYEIYYCDKFILKKLDNNFFLPNFQKNPHNKIIGYVQNFIGIHKDNSFRYKNIIISDNI